MPRILQLQELITQLMLSVSTAVGIPYSFTTSFPKQKSHALLLFFPDCCIPNTKILGQLNVLSHVHSSAGASMPLIAHFLQQEIRCSERGKEISQRDNLFFPGDTVPYCPSLMSHSVAVISMTICSFAYWTMVGKKFSDLFKESFLNILGFR